jgi:hypothetical protein
MLKKAVKLVGLVLILAASVGSFIFMNSSEVRLNISEGGSFEQSELLPDDHTITTPAVAIAKKAIIIAKCFLYPTE